jgi:hypothetical protein
MQHLIQLPMIPILGGITIVKAYSPLNNSTKLASNNSIVQA